MACPYFLPSQRRDDLLWPFPSRLPLGAGFGGVCSAPGHEGAAPTNDELKSACNLGYARCSRLPAKREADCIRYVVSLDSADRIVVAWTSELRHAPGQQGRTEYDCATRSFARPCSDARIQKQVECYLESYLMRRARHD
jgi:hypothetical protein